MSAFPAGPQFAPPVEQQFSPEGTAVRQFATASRSSAVLMKYEGPNAACTSVAQLTRHASARKIAQFLGANNM